MSQSWDVTLIGGGAVTETVPTVSLVDSDAAARLSLVITHSDGRTTRWGPDELDDALVPSGLRFSTTDPGGDQELSCELLRRVDLRGSDENLLDSVEVIGPGGEVVWEGRMAQFPRQHDDTYSVTPGAEGWVASLRDRVDARELIRDIDLRQWNGIGLTRQNALLAASFTTLPAAEVVRDASGSQALQVGFDTDIWEATNRPLCQAVYDAGGIPIGSLYYAWSIPSTTDYADTDWAWGAYLSDDDTFSSIDSSGNRRGPGPETGTLSATTATRDFASVFLYHSAAKGTAGQPKLRAVNWTSLAVAGNHGLTKRGTEPDAGYTASDILPYLIGKYAPQLTLGDIDTTSTVISQFAFLEPTVPEDMVKRANAPHLKSWGVEPPGRRFYFRAPDPDRLTWKARVDEGAALKLDGPALKTAVNGVVVTFTDPSGRQSSVGPVGSMCEHTDALLGDVSESNPVNQHGMTRYDLLTLSDVNTVAGATNLGAVYLEEILTRPSRRGEVSLTGMVEHTAGPRPVSRIRAGDFIDLTDTNANSLGGPRRIIATSYEHDTRTMTLTLDQTAYTLEALLSVLGAELLR